MSEVIGELWPELTLLIGACVCVGLGVAATPAVRNLSPWVAAAALVAAGTLALTADTRAEAVWTLARFTRVAVAAIGLLLVMLQPRSDDGAARGSGQGEYYAFLLFSLTGVMLCGSAEDLVWLFLALELTSLPTYVMVATRSNSAHASEAAVKYFFLGAMAAAIFLYGFTLIYGASGSTQFAQIRSAIASGPAVPPLMVVGLVLAVVGISFKIAAVPMHFYAADVYQGAATPVTALLAFVPKTAGFLALIAILGLLNWDLPEPVVWLLWAMAVATMTVGNVLGLMQRNVKRVLAYSSIAHSGYMLVGLVAGAATRGGSTLSSGVAAVLFYLVGYGLATAAAFGVLGCIQRGKDEAQDYDDISGLSRREPVLSAVLLLAILSLLGFPLTVGFLGKVYLFGAAMSHASEGRYVWLVVIAVLNSAVSAVYYLRIIGACYFGEPRRPIESAGTVSPRWASGIAAVAAVALFVCAGPLVDAARNAAPKAGAVDPQRPVTVVVNPGGSEAVPGPKDP